MDTPQGQHSPTAAEAEGADLLGPVVLAVTVGWEGPSLGTYAWKKAGPDGQGCPSPRELRPPAARCPGARYSWEASQGLDLGELAVTGSVGMSGSAVKAVFTLLVRSRSARLLCRHGARGPAALRAPRPLPPPRPRPVSQPGGRSAACTRQGFSSEPELSLPRSSSPGQRAHFRVQVAAGRRRTAAQGHGAGGRRQARRAPCRRHCRPAQGHAGLGGLGGRLRRARASRAERGRGPGLYIAGGPSPAPACPPPRLPAPGGRLEQGALRPSAFSCSVRAWTSCCLCGCRESGLLRWRRSCCPFLLLSGAGGRVTGPVTPAFSLGVA